MASFSLNRFQALGNLTRDAELKYVNNGDAVLEFSIACNTRVKKGEEWVDGEPYFAEFAYWGKAAEGISQIMTKGKKVFAEGTLKLETWDDRETGAKRSKVKCKADIVVPMEREERREEAPAARAPAKSNAGTRPLAKSASAGLDDQAGF